MSSAIDAPERSVKSVREMSVLVYGAGPVGSLIAYRLQDSDLDVTVLARGQRFDYITRYGIMLEPFGEGSTTSRKVKVIERLMPLDAYDLVIVSLGKNYYQGVIPFLVANIHTPNVLFLGNNAMGPREIVNLLERERILMGFPVMKGIMRGRVVRHDESLKPSILLGELDGDDSERVRNFRELLEVAGFARARTMAGAYCRAGGDFTKLTRDKETLTLMFRAMREGFSALKELGYPILPEGFKRMDWVPLNIVTLYAGRMMKNRETEYVLANHEAMRGELRVLDREFREMLLSTSIQTPAYNELCEYLPK